ncbi:FAD-dependent oxidoreductase [Kinneretia asaccharophila]|uniref:Tryptophan 2-monooxygenase n=1 Tax=Roseateles asaccharophilus TaxID=582607 RepID=A0A4R6NC32_9BURK|nr:FAD-dependent oxidoreductase [Roseateles asaccharophilus]MDN3543114.1 FAD-dependent oxidoreductase [Roseateles asaccharophilus]TDP13188.1 monoamine oxidase [Roseateles asaccharophilus]
MKRRQALGATGLGLGSILSMGMAPALAQLQRASDRQPVHAADAPRVIVVGAGIAGLAAAQRLRAAGQRVLVLEARERSGGRIFTSQAWRGPAMDLGASWIHGAGPANPLTQLARRIGARTFSTDMENAQAYDGLGGELRAAEQRRLADLRGRIGELLAERELEARDVSLQALVYEALDYTERPAPQQRLIDFLLNSEFEHEYGAATRQLSARWFDAGSAYEGGELIFPDGYKALIDHLSTGLDIRLQHEVREIDYQGAAGVTVRTQHGSFSAPQLIVTLPLGVLKAGKVRFSPALPSRKQIAIEHLGMGVLNKCCLLFERAFWDTQLDWLNHLPPTGRAGQWTEWVSLARPSGAPVLMGFNAADHGRRIEAMSDAALAQDAMAVLRRMFGSQIPAPQDVLVSRWASDPHALGAYSCHVLGSHPAQRDDLAQSVNGRLFFAGEATDRQHYQTVHGAYQSGLRAAQELLRAGGGQQARAPVSHSA